MKKLLTIAMLAFMFSATTFAQDDKSDWTLNTRAWSTNYFTTILYDLAASAVKHFAFHSNEKDSLLAEHIIPMGDLVFPIGMGKKGFESPKNIYGPYHRAFGNPFKHIGDWGIGIDASYHPSFIGFYAGAYFKSKEIVSKETDDNLRGFYFQPRAGLIIGRDEAIEAGFHYDVVTGCKSTMGNANKDMLDDGFGLDFALSTTTDKGRGKVLLQFSMPLHNFLNTDHPNFKGMKRKVGYIMLTHRVGF